MDWQKRFAKTLKGLGHEVVKIYSKAEGVLEGIKKFRPDLFLIDIHLRNEGVTGIELGQKIGNMGIPYILITQLEEDKHHTQAYQNSAHPADYIKKSEYGIGFSDRMRLVIKKIFINEQFFSINGEHFSYSNVLFVYKQGDRGFIRFNNRVDFGLFSSHHVNLSSFLEGEKYYCESFYQTGYNHVVNIKNVLGLTREGQHNKRGRLFFYFTEEAFLADSPNNLRIKDNSKLEGLVLSGNKHAEFKQKLGKYCQGEIRNPERTSDILIKNTLP